MGGWSRRTGALLAAGAVIGMAMPAEADPARRGGDRQAEHRRDRHGQEAKEEDAGLGGFLVGALLAGGIIAALTSKKKAPAPPADDAAFVPVGLSEPPTDPAPVPAEAD